MKFEIKVLNSEESVLERAYTKERHAVVCVSRKQVKSYPIEDIKNHEMVEVIEMVWYPLWSGLDIETYLKTTEIPFNIEHFTYVKIDGLWCMLDWYAWHRMKYDGLSVENALPMLKDEHLLSFFKSFIKLINEILVMNGG